MASAAPSPLLTVGMPVYNGAATLEAALRSVLDQTLADIEVVISDNVSTDATPDICRRIAAEDPRVRYVRQEKALSPTDNFRFVLDAARAPFFMWAAHDDTRDPDFAERLVARLQAEAGAILAFGDLVQVEPDGPRPHRLDFVTSGMSPGKRLRMNAWRQLHHLYGVWRTDALRRVDWRHVDWWHDTPLMMAAALLGDYVHAPGTRFVYLYNPRPFFGWRRPGETPSLRRDLGQFVNRVRELWRLVILTYGTVARVGGPLRGWESACYVALKVAGQIAMFAAQRLPIIGRWARGRLRRGVGAAAGS